MEEEELPDIPYTPMRETSYDEAGPSCSSTGNIKQFESMIYIIEFIIGPPAPKRRRALTAAEKKARYRANRSAAQKAEEQRKDKEAKARKRQERTAEEHVAAKNKNKAEQKKHREAQTSEKRAIAKEKHKAEQKKYFSGCKAHVDKKEEH